MENIIIPSWPGIHRDKPSIFFTSNEIDFELHDQEKLIDYASTRASYIEEWWDDSYLSYSDSVVLSLNPFFILEDSTSSKGGQLPRASSLILGALGFIHDLRSGELEPDAIRGVALDMGQVS